MMLPREHGAYGQLLLPMATALAIGRPSLAAVAIAVAAVAAFVSHEPLMVLGGARGARVLREQRREATWWLFGAAATAVCLGAVALVLLPADDRWTLAVPLAPAALAVVWIARGRGRTKAGEMIAAAALASVAFPIAVASSATVAVALTCTLAYVAGFAAATVAVRAVIARARGERRQPAPVAAAVLLSIAVAALSARRVILPAALWAALPVCTVALGLAIAAPPPRYLRQIGWTLVGATLLTGVILVAAVR
jgi:hypothetical protein